MLVSAIIVAAGQGERFGSDLPKQFVELAGKPVLSHTLEKFVKVPRIGQIVLVVADQWQNWVWENTVRQSESSKPITVVSGGPERQESVANGLAAVLPNTEIVLIHDAVRPLVGVSHIERVIDAVCEHEAAILAVEVVETVKQVVEGRILNTVDRQGLYTAQTPQGFKKAVLERAMIKARTEGFVGTDEAMLVERLGIPVQIVRGDQRNIKITTPEDLEFARTLLHSI